jgi:hypothetical protein
MAWALRSPCQQTRRNVWIRPLALVACALLLGPQTAPAQEPASGPPEEAAPSAAVEADQGGRRALEAEVDRLRATVEELEASRDATARELQSLRALIEAAGIPSAPTSPDEAAPSTPPSATVAQEAVGESPEPSPSPTVAPVIAATADEAEPEPPEGPAPQAGTESTAVPPVVIATAGEAESKSPEGTAAPEATPEQEKVGQSWERDARYQAERDILEQRGGVLLPGGQLVIQPGFSYTNMERNRIRLSGFALLPAILIGRIDSVEIDRDIYQITLQARYGLHDRIEVAASLPYLWRVESEIFGTTGEETRDILRGDGIGDLELSLLAHVFEEQGWIPDIILNLRGRAPTGDDPFEVDEDEVALGSGFWGLSSGITLTKVLDPVVLFASGNYVWNAERKISDVGRVDPGDSFEYNLGLALGLNERLALSLSVQHRIIGRTELDGDKLDLTDINAAAFFVGTSYVLNRWLSPSLSVGFGLTNDSPDYQVQLTFPIRYPKRLPSLPFDW